MEFKPNFTLCQSDCCTTLQMCDITCDQDPINPANCCDGYGITDDGSGTDQVFRSNVASTRFNFIMPDGRRFTDIDLNYVPPQYATINFTLASGSPGDGVVVIMENVLLGDAFYVSDTSDLVVNLVNSINLNSPVTKWRAYYIDYTIYIYSVGSGIEFNDQTLNVYLTSGATVEVTMDTDITVGANDSDGCVEFTLRDIYGVQGCKNECFQDGVYTVTYSIRDINGLELGRNTKSFLLDCNTKKCICNQVKKLADSNCGCTDDAWEKVLNLQSTLAAIWDEFNTGNCECANEHIQDLHDRCRNMCLDC